MSKIETNTIDNISGSSTLTIGDTNTSTITLKSGATLTNFPTNTPFFYGELSSGKTLTRATLTKIDSMTSNEVDSDTAFNGTTFTVPSGKAGTYFIHATLEGDSQTAGQDGEEFRAQIYKNGSSIKSNRFQNNTGVTATGRRKTVSINVTLALSVGDTIELYGHLQDSNGSGNMDCVAGGTSIGGYKIIE